MQDASQKSTASAFMELGTEQQKLAQAEQAKTAVAVLPMGADRLYQSAREADENDKKIGWHPSIFWRAVHPQPKMAAGIKPAP